MQKYARIIDHVNGICEVGTGNPDAVYRRIIDPETGKEKTLYVRDFYISRGMELMDVEHGHNGNWYVAGKAPAPPEKKVIRTFAKDAIWVATKDMVIDTATGLTAWEAFKTFLLDSGLWEGWTMQAYLLESNPFFEEFYPEACEKLGKDLVDRVLSASVFESKIFTIG